MFLTVAFITALWTQQLPGIPVYTPPMEAIETVRIEKADVLAIPYHSRLLSGSGCFFTSEEAGHNRQLIPMKSTPVWTVGSFFPK